MRFSTTPLGWPLALALASAAIAATPAAAPAQSGVATTNGGTVQVSTNRGRLVTLARPMSDLFVANPDIADVQVRSPTQLYVFGKKPGETTVSATAKGGAVVYAATVRVGNNYDSIQSMLNLAMPDAQITATTMNGMVLLTGTVRGPEDGAEAEKLVAAFVGENTKVLSRLRTATPLQVNLQVKFAEVNRSFLKNIGNNLLTRDTTNGFNFSIGSGRVPGTIGNADTSGFPLVDASSRYGLPAGSVNLPFNPKTGQFVYPNSGSSYSFNNDRPTTARTSIGLAGKLLGLDVLSAIDLGEQNGQVTLLANPNLTALSGETGTFLAGGEIPIPIAQGLGSVSIEYKEFGVSLAYTPTVLSDGRISLRVRPEVSNLDYSNAVPFGGTQIPALTTRRAETTVELGSGQSFMIAGLMSNNHYNNFSKTPGVGDVPVLGALFRSNAFQRNETELVIIITPYLVKPVNGTDIALPTDGYKAPTDLQRVLLGQLTDGQSAAERPKPTMQVAPAAAPAIGAAATTSAARPLPQPLPAAPAQSQATGAADRKAAKPATRKGPAPAPGFSIN
ncbi:type II and III secretion system protein family protein [Sphingomonas sp. RHCKR47]|uniref:type II and III secretion system protein family protein n=1 Tax=Sphingomonas citricola TaxID=2862498 RepID=UPI001C663A64|nr:type II and III secretion system protein family protein [Sphingomonas citricola]MBW6523017.1 type II and III secretion system protein family protein [Sphingomonas citricola]